MPVTVLKVANVQVLAQRTEEKNGYTALQLGAGTRKASTVSRAERQNFAVAKVEPKRKLAEFCVAESAMVEPGTELVPSHFVPGQYVDIVGETKGKGFAGAMKRWNFGGLEASHGVSVSHRSHGSTGNRQYTVAGDYQGRSSERKLYLGSEFPGNDKGADRSRDRRQDRHAGVRGRESRLRRPGIS